jgi:hypothetical protein
LTGDSHEEATMRMLKLAVAAGLLLSTAACAVYTRDYPPDRYYAPHYYAYSYGPGIYTYAREAP